MHTTYLPASRIDYRNSLYIYMGAFKAGSRLTIISVLIEGGVVVGIARPYMSVRGQQ